MLKELLPANEQAVAVPEADPLPMEEEICAFLSGPLRCDASTQTSPLILLLLFWEVFGLTSLLSSS